MAATDYLEAHPVVSDRFRLRVPEGTNNAIMRRVTIPR